MDQRLKNLEDLSELITKEIVQQNKSMIEMNKNLLCEIKSLREAFVKQDEDFEEFKNLLKKIYDLNKQQGLIHNPMQNLMYQPQQGPHSQPPLSTQSSVSNQNQHMPPSFSLNNLMGTTNLNNSYMGDQVNQSMMNNLSFQSERTPLNIHQQNPNSSLYSIPSSASAMTFNHQQNQQPQPFTPYLNNQLAPGQQQGSSQKPTPGSYPTIKQQQIPSQQQFMTNVGNNSFKSLPQPQQQIPNLQQPPPQISQPQPPQQQQPPKSFSFSNLNKPPVVNGTDAVKLEQQRKNNFPVAPIATQATSTPQPSQLFPISKLTQETGKPKPPQFQFSPTKQPESTISTLKPFSSMTSSASTTSIPSTTPSIFGSNLFKIATPEKNPTMTNSPSAPIIKAPEPVKFGDIVDDGDEAAGGNPEEFEPQVDFKPIVKLQTVEIKTGEEDEDVLLKLRCKLFRFDLNAKDWKEKGLGDIKFLKHKKTGVVRILMRREQVLKICANHRLNQNMILEELGPKQFKWSAVDFAEGNEGKAEVLLARFKLPEEGTSFKKEFEKAVEASKDLANNTPVKSKETASKTTKASTKSAPAPLPAASTSVPAAAPSKLSQLFKTDKWNCTGCYVANKKDDLKCICCDSFKPGHTAADLPKTESAPSNAGQFSFGMKPADSSKTFSFGILAKSEVSPTKSAAPLFGSKQMPSFGDLASGVSSTGKPLFGSVGFQPQNVKPLFGSVFQVPNQQAQSTTPAAEDEDAAGGENPEEYEPQVDFKPIVKLQEVETKTGEENEDVVFKARCKLFRYEKASNEWKEKGLGEMKVLRNKEHSNMHRILMRRDQVLKLCANHRITSELAFEVFNEKQVRWHAEDYSEGSGKHELLAARFKHESEAQAFKKACEDALDILKKETKTSETATSTSKPAASCEGLKSSMNEMFKNDSFSKSSGSKQSDDGEKALTASIGKISFGAPADVKAGISAPVIFGSSQPTEKKDDKVNFDFGSKSLFGTGVAAQPTNSIFGAALTPPVFGAQKPDVASVFGSKSSASFADLATKTQQTGFGGGFTGFSSTAGQPKPLFGFGQSTTTSTTEGGDEEGAGAENPEEYEPQVDFQPLVKLQEVETKTGEEDEEILFKQRCKLFRFNNNTKEWKEKGLGDIKILKHKFKENHYRILMRREQVLKLCANHRINTAIKMENVTEKQVTWYVQDCSEDEPHAEILLAKFRLEDDATKFKKEVERVQKILSASQTEKPEPEIKAPSSSTPETSDSDTPVVLKIVEASKEQVDKARQFNLPDNFYLYETLGKECPGCRGCE